FLSHGELLNHDLLKRQVDDQELRFRSRGAPGFRASAVDDQQCKAATRRILGGERAGDFGIAVSEERIVGINYFVGVLRLVEHWVGATRNNDDVVGSVTVQV